MPILIRNGRVVDVFQGINKVQDMTIEGGDGDFNATGMIVVPGLFDMHCHLRDFGQAHKGTIESECLAALHGGFTGVLAMPNTVPTIDSAEMVQVVKEKAVGVAVDVYVAGAVSRGLAGEELTGLGEMERAGVAAFTDDGMPVSDKRFLEKALLATDKLVIYHSEEFGIDEADAEWVDAEKAIEVAERLGKRIHITHISSKKTVEIIREAKARGVAVTCDTCPHFFSLTDEAIAEKGTDAKMNPPLKKAEDVAAIIEGLKDGTIDAISTDHAPHSVSEKAVDYEVAPNGIIGFETAVGLAVTTLVKAGYLSWMELVEKMSVKPRELLGIGASGWTIIDAENEYEVDIDSFRSMARNSPFNGAKLYGKVVAVCVQDNEKGTAELHIL